MTRTYSFSATQPWAIGFESILDRFNDTSPYHTSNYPPYNIIKEDETNWLIEVAIAGFKRNEIDVQLAEGILTVSAKAEENVLETSDIVGIKKSTREYVHRGIGKRTFIRKWTLAEDVVVGDASLSDGLLSIKLERIIPEEKKPRKIEIL